MFNFLKSDVNKHKQPDQETEEGIGELIPELELDMKDSELIELSKSWNERWKKYVPEIEKRQKENENYWLGKQFESDSIDDRPIMDNLIFESVETFLPIATKRNPEPVVVGESEEQIELAKEVQKMLVYQADVQKLKLKLKKVCRYWAMYLIGVVEISWSVRENDIVTKAIRPQQLILDPDAEIDDEMQYTGEYIGKYHTEVASDMIKRFKNKEKEIKSHAQDKMGTKITYIKWWTNEYCFYTLGDIVLGKHKNPHWNYDEQTTSKDEYGNDIQTLTPGKNHFKNPRMPFEFLSIFNLGKHPHDDTSLIEQNLSNQDMINKRQAQIDKNVDGINGGWGVSGEKSGLTKEQASEAIDEAKRGGAIWIETGNVNEALIPIKGASLSPEVFNHLADTRSELRNNFGIRGSSAQGTISEQTLGGKQIVKEQDSSRIGGGISEYLEQFADGIYNWWVQMMYVYYNDQHVGSIIGEDKKNEYVALANSDFEGQLLVSVKEGSLLPKDQFSEANTILQLAGMGMADSITVFDKLGFSDPVASAERLYRYQNAPETLFQEAGQEVAMINEEKQAQQMASELEMQDEQNARDLEKQILTEEMIPPQ